MVLVMLALIFILPWSALVASDYPPLWAVLGNWLFAGVVGIITACLVKSPGRQQALRCATQKPRDGVPPKVWIIMLPVLFLVLCMQWDFILADNYGNFGDVLILWLLPGLASLIILLPVKLGSRKSMDLPAQEALQQVQARG